MRGAALVLVGAVGCGGSCGSGDAVVGADASPSVADAAASVDGGPSDRTPGAGKDTYRCPPGALALGEGDDVTSAINDAPAGAVICIEGRHEVSARLVLEPDQHLIGIGRDARLSGARELVG